MSAYSGRYRFTFSDRDASDRFAAFLGSNRISTLIWNGTQVEATMTDSDLTAAIAWCTGSHGAASVSRVAS